MWFNLCFSLPPSLHIDECPSICQRWRHQPVVRRNGFTLWTFGVLLGMPFRMWLVVEGGFFLVHAPGVWNLTCSNILFLAGWIHLLHTCMGIRFHTKTDIWRRKMSTLEPLKFQIKKNATISYSLWQPRPSSLASLSRGHLFRRSRVVFQSPSIEPQKITKMLCHSKQSMVDLSFKQKLKSNQEGPWKSTQDRSKQSHSNKSPRKAHCVSE